MECFSFLIHKWRRGCPRKEMPAKQVDSSSFKDVKNGKLDREVQFHQSCQKNKKTDRQIENKAGRQKDRQTDRQQTDKRK